MKPLVVPKTVPPGPLMPGDVVVECGDRRSFVARRQGAALQILMLDAGLHPVNSAVLGLDAIAALIDVLEDAEEEIESVA